MEPKLKLLRLLLELMELTSLKLLLESLVMQLVNLPSRQLLLQPLQLPLLPKASKVRKPTVSTITGSKVTAAMVNNITLLTDNSMVNNMANNSSSHNNHKQEQLDTINNNNSNHTDKIRTKLTVSSKHSTDKQLQLSKHRKETPTAMGKVNKINGLDLKEEMTMVQTDSMEESKIMETRIPEVATMVVIVMVAITTMVLQEVEAEGDSKAAAAAVVSTEAAEVVEEAATSVEEEEVSIDMTITTITNTAVAAAE